MGRQPLPYRRRPPGSPVYDAHAHQRRQRRHQTLLEFLRQGDALVVTRIDRLARSIAHLQGIVATLKRKGAALICAGLIEAVARATGCTMPPAVRRTKGC